MIISVSTSFADLLYTLFLAPFPSPSTLSGLGIADIDTLRGLALPI
jgi:hypothetical protein